ncbi:hypothetical protein D3C78_1572550 [compost metagenome]
MHKDVVVTAGHPDANNGAQQTHRHNQQDGQRQQPAVVLSGKDEIGQKHTQREDEQRRIPGQLLLVGKVGPFKSHAFRQHFFRQTLHHGYRLTRTDAGHRAAGDVGGRIAVVVDHSVWA